MHTHTQKHNFSDFCMIQMLGFFKLCFREERAVLHAAVKNSNFTHEK